MGYRRINCPGNTETIKNNRQSAPSPVGEGWGEGKWLPESDVTEEKNSPLPNPLPQEREQMVGTFGLSVKAEIIRVGWVENPTQTPARPSESRVAV